MAFITGKFPETRLRRTRQTEWCRGLVAETTLSVKNLILPVFIRDNESPRDIPSMPDISRHSLEELIPFCDIVCKAGIPAVALFPYTRASLKCDQGSEALNPENLVCRGIQLIKKHYPDLGVIVDVALDPYTSHGHDGVIRNNYVDNDESVSILKDMALLLAEVGVDIVAPSDTMDGRVGVIREALDQRGYDRTQILAYSAKYASAFYGPFRDAVGSKGCLGVADKKTYQMDPANIREALREAALDVLEGADMLMVKPGLPYLDIVYRLYENFPLPIFVYQVSSEYSSLKTMASYGWVDYDKALMETLIAFRRAGASAILTYAALDAARILKER